MGIPGFGRAAWRRTATAGFAFGLLALSFTAGAPAAVAVPHPPCSAAVPLFSNTPGYGDLRVCIQITTINGTKYLQALAIITIYINDDENEGNGDDDDPFDNCTAQVTAQNLTRGTIEKAPWDCYNDVNDTGIHNINTPVGLVSASGDQVVAHATYTGETATGFHSATASTVVWRIP